MLPSPLIYLLRILALPLFFLFHLTFTISSLLLRTYQAFTTTNPTSETLIHEYDPLPSKSPFSDSDNQPRSLPPKHLALVLVPSRRTHPGGSVRLRREKDALVESVLRLVEWGGERGIKEISVWDGQGRIQSLLPRLVQDLSTYSSSTLPPSPPSSSPSTPSPRPTQDLPECELPLTPRSPPECNDKARDGNCDGRLTHDGVMSVEVHPRKQRSKGLTVHFLPPSSSSSLVTDLTKKYAASQLSLQEMTVSKVDHDLRQQLNFTHDPDLLIVHHLSPPSIFRSIIPRAAPELWGYPFWALRITEIYQHPTPIPLLHNLTPLIQSLRTSSLPFIRKLGYTISTPPPPSQSVFSKDEWDGAMTAWSNVEQRLGR
ncbi:hypothetical protein CI109_106778 [Kwoniella shandongensis]|uniref:ditrans,polycis-polyprenyl diphosphate synthase [(2E,6E)-farnesyldiphosphate specific] n=1 Tax=Kwoniella shandongensis TaxID=1734106 RepID=A0A5M6C6N8_9TREE|nr:uncharacterized protein CI109_000966 [Kwoniella shandongensis]KAA5530786.1 hypothetical protein CI109_000966 [Kwoniella shandongensis]